MSNKKKLRQENARLRRRLKAKPALINLKDAQPPATKISDAAVSLSGGDRFRIEVLASKIYAAAQPMPGVIPSSAPNRVAMDENIKRASKAAALALDQQIVFAGGWAGSFGQGGYGAFAEGQAFLGYPYLSELAQRPEYRVISETGATEMTRKWIKIKAKGSSGDKSEKISQLEDEFKRLRVQEAFCKVAEYDGFMGRSHLYLDVGKDVLDDRDELKTPIGDGNNSVTEAKVTKGSFNRIKVVEAMWCYPSGYNSTDPLSPDWYNPQMWYAMGKEVHASRFLTFVGREVPDILKPAYSFGGLAMSQMAKPYVDNWLRTRQSVSDLLHSFTVWHLATNLSAYMQEEATEQLFKRIQIFNNLRDNKGMFLTDKETEEFKNVSAQLGTLDALQAQSQEQMCSVARIPTVKLLGIDAQGLNASSEGTIRTFYDSIHATQPKFLGSNLDRVFRFAQINIWGEVDEDLFYEWEQLWSLDEKGQAEVEKIKADTDAVHVDIGSIDSGEVRARLAGSEDSGYQSLNLNKIIVPPEDPSGEHLGLGQGGGIGGNPAAEFKEAAE